MSCLYVFKHACIYESTRTPQESVADMFWSEDSNLIRCIHDWQDSTHAKTVVQSQSFTLFEPTLLLVTERSVFEPVAYRKSELRAANSAIR